MNVSCVKKGRKKEVLSLQYLDIRSTSMCCCLNLNAGDFAQIESIIVLISSTAALEENSQISCKPGV